MPTPASPEVKGGRYRGAVIGAGGIARQSHLPALRDTPSVRARVDVVALVDSALDLPPVDGIPLFTRREQLRDAAPIDFIDICTPTASHLELTVYRLMADPGRDAGGRPWRGTSAAGRGGVLLDHGTHLIYQLLDVAGLPASVS